jgi:MFS transporter, PAT family, beta-lactamase induction signal transducer AmpG
LTPESFAKPAAVLGVSREALGTGYIVFFTYSSVIGVLAIILCVWLNSIPQVLEGDD